MPSISAPKTGTSARPVRRHCRRLGAHRAFAGYSNARSDLVTATGSRRVRLDPLRATPSSRRAPSPEQHRRDVDVSSSSAPAEDCADACAAAGDLDVLAVRRPRAPCSSAASIPSATNVDVVPPCIGERLAGVGRQHEDGLVEGRLLAPPAGGRVRVVRPRPAGPAAVHRAAHDRRAERARALGEQRASRRCPRRRVAVRPSCQRRGGEHPLVQLHASPLPSGSSRRTGRGRRR